MTKPEALKEIQRLINEHKLTVNDCYNLKWFPRYTLNETIDKIKKEVKK